MHHCYHNVGHSKGMGHANRFGLTEPKVDQAPLVPYLVNGSPRWCLAEFTMAANNELQPARTAVTKLRGRFRHSRGNRVKHDGASATGRPSNIRKQILCRDFDTLKRLGGELLGSLNG